MKPATKSDSRPGYKCLQLMAAITELSRDTDWAAICREWTLVDMELSKEWSLCPCTTPIKELCTINNRHTGASIIVGNKCVQRFMGINSTKIFRDATTMSKNIAKPLGADATAFFFENGFFTAWEHGFLVDTRTRKILSLSKKQFDTRLNLNLKLYRHMGFSKEKLRDQLATIEAIYAQLRGPLSNTTTMIG